MSDQFSDREKIDQVEKAFTDFLDALGPDDIYKQIFLEVLFKELYGKTIHLSYWSEPEGIQTNSNDGGYSPTDQNNNSQGPEPTG